MIKLHRKIFSMTIISLIFCMMISGYSLECQAKTNAKVKSKTQNTTKTKKQAKNNAAKLLEFKAKIKAVQKKYGATDFETYEHIFDAQPPNPKLAKELTNGAIKRATDKINKAKAELPKYANDNSLYGQSKVKELNRIISFQRNEIAISKMALNMELKDYPLYYSFKVIDDNNIKCIKSIIEINYNFFNYAQYFSSHAYPLGLKYSKEINDELEMWKNSDDVHKKERIDSLTKEFYPPGCNVLTHQYDVKALEYEAKDYAEYKAFFTELWNAIKNY